MDIIAFIYSLILVYSIITPYFTPFLVSPKNLDFLGFSN